MALFSTLKEVRIHLSEVSNEPSKPLHPKLLDRIDSLAMGMHDKAELFLGLTFFILTREHV